MSNLARLTPSNIVVSVRFQAPYQKSGSKIPSSDGTMFAGKVMFIARTGKVKGSFFRNQQELITILDNAVLEGTAAGAAGNVKLSE